MCSREYGRGLKALVARYGSERYFSTYNRKTMVYRSVSYQQNRGDKAKKIVSVIHM